MHYRTFLLVKANGENEARRKAEEFLEPYGDDREWDWYAIEDGRWSDRYGTITKATEFTKGFKEVAKMKREALKDREVLKAIILGNKIPKIKPSKERGLRSRAEALIEYRNKKDISMFMYIAEMINKKDEEVFHTEVGYYNVENEDCSVPEDLSGYYVVNVDLHI